MNPKRSSDYLRGYADSRKWHKIGPEFVYHELSTPYVRGWNAYVRDRQLLARIATIGLRLILAASILATIWLGYTLSTI